MYMKVSSLLLPIQDSQLRTASRVFELIVSFEMVFLKTDDITKCIIFKRQVFQSWSHIRIDDEGK